MRRRPQQTLADVQRCAGVLLKDPGMGPPGGGTVRRRTRGNEPGSAAGGIRGTKVAGRPELSAPSLRARRGAWSL
jgi:hypothetical protein